MKNSNKTMLSGKSAASRIQATVSGNQSAVSRKSMAFRAAIAVAMIALALTCVSVLSGCSVPSAQAATQNDSVQSETLSTDATTSNVDAVILQQKASSSNAATSQQNASCSNGFIDANNDGICDNCHNNSNHNGVCQNADNTCSVCGSACKNSDGICQNENCPNYGAGNCKNAANAGQNAANASQNATCANGGNCNPTCNQGVGNGCGNAYRNGNGDMNHFGRC